MAQFTAADGTRLHYRDEGQGLAVLALAGLTRDGRDFDYLARHLTGVRLIRLDSRGRGGSEFRGPYTVPQEAADAVALLDHLGLARVGILGASRGGLIALLLAATAKPRLAGICFNDIGPVIERAGLTRIGAYLGLAPQVATLAEVADRLPAANPGFARVPAIRWQEEAVRHYVQADGAVGLTYDPALKESFEAAMGGDLPDLWPLFDACAGLPLAAIRGANSDLLSAETLAEMARRRPDLIAVTVPDRGHIPFLDEPEAVKAIQTWLAALQGV